MSNQEASLQRARDMKAKQDAKIPFLIHRVNGRLIPNVERLRDHKYLIPYRGSVKASHEERMRYLRTGGAASRSFVDSAPLEQDLPPFDLGTASREEMVQFAADEYGIQLNVKAPAHILRNQIKAAAAEQQEGGEPPAADADDTVA
jgi:hypothetical protein